MTSTDELLTRIAPSLASLEARRISLLAKRRTGAFWMLGVVVVGLLSFFLLAPAQNGSLLIAPFAIFLGLIICHLVFFGSSKSEFRTSFKNEVVTTVAQTLVPGMTFHPQKFVSKDWFRQSGLFRRPDRYRGEDFFIGTIGKTEIFFSEVHAEREETSADDHTSYYTIFKGIFLVADFHKEFRSKVTVTPDKMEGFGFLGKKLQSLDGRVERLENVDFESLFVVRASDPIEARYILTPAMQERFIDLTEKWGSEIRASFQDSLVFLALPNRNDWFEGDIRRQVNDSQQFRTLVAQLHACFSTVEDLDLNTRIWTKE